MGAEGAKRRRRAFPRLGRLGVAFVLQFCPQWSDQILEEILAQMGNDIMSGFRSAGALRQHIDGIEWGSLLRLPWLVGAVLRGKRGYALAEVVDLRQRGVEVRLLLRRSGWVVGSAAEQEGVDAGVILALLAEQPAQRIGQVDQVA